MGDGGHGKRKLVKFPSGGELQATLNSARPHGGRVDAVRRPRGADLSKNRVVVSTGRQVSRLGRLG